MNKFRSKAHGQYPAIILLVIFVLACAGTTVTPAAIEPSQTAPNENLTQTGPSPTEPPAVFTTPLGESPENPAPRSETIPTAGWEFKVIQVVRGDEALAMLKAASLFNKEHPDPSMEYVVVNVHAKYVATDTDTHHIDTTFFSGMGNANVQYEKVRIVDVETPSPSISSFDDLTSGGEVEGWVVIQVGKDESGIMLIIWPRNNGFILGDETIRYVSLE